MNSDLLFLVGIPGLFCVFIVIIFFLAVRESKKTISKLSMVLPEVGNIDFHLHPSGTANYAGQRYDYLYYTGSRQNPCRLSISVEAKFQAKFSIANETKTDKFFKKIGVNHEVQTGDLDFDNKYYLLSDSSDFVASTLREKGCRDAVRTIFEIGFTEIQLNDDKLCATWYGFNFPSHVQVESITRVINSLRQIVKNIPQQLPDVVAPRRGFQLETLVRYTVHAVPYVLGAVGFVLMVLVELPLDPYVFFLKSLLVSLPVFAISILLVMNVFRGRPHSGRDVAAFFFAGLFAFPILFYGWGVYLNCKTDHSSVIRHEVLVVSKRIERSKSSTSYYMKVASWRQARGSETLRVSLDLFEKIQPGNSRVEIASRSGALRHEWVESFSMLD